MRISGSSTRDDLREIASVANGRRVRHSAMNVRQVCLRVYRIICEKKMPAVPSPDGRHLALTRRSLSSTVWPMENC